jgi:hypothetical protein
MRIRPGFPRGPGVVAVGALAVLLAAYSRPARA